MRVATAVFAIALMACVHSESATCGDGRVCPSQRVCDDVHALCVSRDQLSQCATKADHERCASDIGLGLCDRGVCLPACGDTSMQAGEECDDGNFINHDGCSSTCTVEAPTWTNIPNPWSARKAHAAAYDSARAKLVVFGGFADLTGANGGRSDETWERDVRGAWKRIAVTGPSARTRAAMAYDVARSKIVLFGGVNNESEALGDTWEYDGISWVQRTLTPAPAPRYQAAMAYHSGRQKIVMFGGFGGSDLWEYDGTTWSPLATTATPVSNVVNGMAYNASRNTLVFFDASGATWELNGTTWSQQSGTQPTGRDRSATTYVGAPTNAVVMFGGLPVGTGGGGFNDTWANTTTWSAIEIPCSMRSRLN